MAVADFQSLMMPLLRIAGDGREHSLAEARDILAAELRLSNADREATAYVDRIDPKVVLIDGRRLADLMIDSDLGVNTAATYNVKRMDSDYFDETGAV